MSKLRIGRKESIRNPLPETGPASAQRNSYSNRFFRSLLANRRTSLAVHNLRHQPTRTGISILGIAFAVLLMFMQLGFLGSVGDTATLVYQRMSGDLVVRSREYLSVYDPRTIDERVLNRLVSLPEVTEVRPLDLSVALWHNPINGQQLAVAIMGLDVDQPALRIDGLDPLLPLLRRRDHLLVDRTSRSDFGPQDGIRFGDEDIGITTTVNYQSVRIAGTFEMGTGLAANGAVLTSRDGFRRLAGRSHDGQVSLVVVRLADSVSAIDGQRSIVERLSQDGGSLMFADVLTLDQAAMLERRHWYLETPVGIIFWVGVALAVVVGGVICYMVLAADVITHLPEYATLKALGYSNGYLGRTLLLQAVLLAAIALPVATGAAWIVFHFTSAASGLPIRLTWQWIGLVTILTLVMCGAAGTLTLRKLAKAEPASLF